MDDYFPRSIKRYWRFKQLANLGGRFRRIFGTPKKNILLIAVLVLCIRLFFYTIPAESSGDSFESDFNVDPEILDPLEKVIGDNKCINVQDKSLGSDNLFSSQGNLGDKKPSLKKELPGEDALRTLVSGSPIENMLPFIVERRKDVGAYLIAIAKKESDWGRHSPSKNGRDCYNYWGFKGSYNLTASGYSCFDSPEQAIEMVGNKIEELIDKKVNTPERMVVWKCGSSCAGHDPQSVVSWINSVKTYYQKSFIQ